MSELSELYQEVILDHSRSPHNYGPLSGATHSAKGHNPLCGDHVTVQLIVDQNHIKDVHFEGNGCAISKSSASVMTDAVKGQTKEAATRLFDHFHHLVTVGTSPPIRSGQAQEPAPTDGIDRLDVFSGVAQFPTRVKCAILAWHTLKAALDKNAEPVSTQ